MLNVMMKDKLESGLEIPKKGYTVFINNPMNIKVAILNPTVYNIVSILPSL